MSAAATDVPPVGVYDIILSDVRARTATTGRNYVQLMWTVWGGRYDGAPLLLSMMSSHTDGRYDDYDDALRAAFGPDVNAQCLLTYSPDYVGRVVRATVGRRSIHGRMISVIHAIWATNGG